MTEEEKRDREYERIRALEVMVLKEELLSKIIVWLKTKDLYIECLEVVAPEMLLKKKDVK
jgi:hypothetical protein